MYIYKPPDYPYTARLAYRPKEGSPGDNLSERIFSLGSLSYSDYGKDRSSSESAMPPFWKKKTNSLPTDLVGGPYHAIPDNKSIRYMVLEAGKDDEPLVCSLHVSCLRKMPYFEAISYVWGSDGRNHDILCDGKIVKITTNLQQVLRRSDLRLLLELSGQIRSVSIRKIE